ncbi:MAG: U32 family peptidase C-terminal domain-containing protein, partial [Cellvibrionaceae bacterium]|nr:U32 family peptidase C-terminal domain-containing protein [Cellvibrionaceae bacterium]
KNLMAELEHLANRGYTEGFYRRHVPSEYQNYEQGISTNPNQQFVGETIAADGQRLTIDVKNRFSVGDTLELISPSGNHTFKLENMRDKHNADTDTAPGSGHIVSVELPGDIQLPNEGEYSLLMRYTA